MLIKTVNFKFSITQQFSSVPRPDVIQTMLKIKFNLNNS